MVSTLLVLRQYCIERRITMEKIVAYAFASLQNNEESIAELRKIVTKELATQNRINCISAAMIGINAFLIYKLARKLNETIKKHNELVDEIRDEQDGKEN